MEFKIEKVYERDIDLLIINKFMNDDDFGNLFLEKIKSKLPASIKEVDIKKFVQRYATLFISMQLKKMILKKMIRKLISFWKRLM